MNKRVAFPFLTLSDAAIQSGPWLVSLDEGEFGPVGDFLPDWDYASKIRVQRALTLDRVLATNDLEITEANLSLSAGLRVGTGSGRLPRSIILQERKQFEMGSDEVKFDFEISGGELSTILDLFVEVVVDGCPLARGELSPGNDCERVWHETHRVRIEGEEPRFPIEVADLRALLGDCMASAAPWYLHWSPSDWSRDFHGSMRLYLNKAHPEFIERVQEGDPETLRAIMADVMGQVCERFINLDATGDIEDAYEPGSLGSQAHSWIRLAWPGKDIPFVRSQLESRPGAFKAAFLALAQQRGVEP